MSVPSVNITIEKGADFYSTYYLSGPEGDPLNLNGYTAVAKIRKHPSSQISHSFATNLVTSLGKVIIGMGYDVTSELSEGRNYYDIFIINNSTGEKTKVIQGSAIVNPSISV